MDTFTHNQYTFWCWDCGWETGSSWHLSDLYREMDRLVEEGIPLEALSTVHRESDGRGYHRLCIARSVDAQIGAFVERRQQAWLAQKAIDDARWEQQKTDALANQAPWGDVNWDEFF